ncbi:MAG TPA: toll/interleukin-1 receptor domain-containing protein, partial [Chitinophagaceae bacterium]|nr:toll/interleukin-1 receptor domain-containing protein [Chitinophagaceae bacterium]
EGRMRQFQVQCATWTFTFLQTGFFLLETGFFPFDALLYSINTLLVMHDIFISYTQPDRHTAYAIHDALAQNGIKAWMAGSITDGVKAGSPYKKDVVTAIANCKIFLLLYSEFVNQSRDVKGELALAEKKVIIPIRMDHSEMCEELKYDLKCLEFIDASQGGIGYIMSRLLRDIPPILGNSTGSPAMSTDKVLLRKGTLAVSKKLYTEAKRIIHQYIEIAPEDMEARYYFCLCLLNGKRPEKADYIIIQAIEKHLCRFIHQPGSDHIKLLLAMVKHGYYGMNGMRETNPTSVELASNCSLDAEKASEIIYHVHDPANPVWKFIYQIAYS